MDPGEHEALLRTLTGMAAHQETMHTDLREYTRQLVEIAVELKAIHARTDATRTRIEALLARRLPPGETGREA